MCRSRLDTAPTVLRRTQLLHDCCMHHSRLQATNGVYILNACREYIEKASVIGVDAEWRPGCRVAELLQLACWDPLHGAHAIIIVR